MINRIFTFVTSVVNGFAYVVLGIGLAVLTGTLIQAFVPSPLERSIVKVTNNEGTGGGTGWVTKTASGQRVIVTNDHVCQVATGDYVRIEGYGGQPSIRAIIRRDAARDLCVIEGVNAPTLPLAAAAPNAFDAITVYGHPFLNPTTPSFGQYLTDAIMPVGFSPNEEGTCDAGELMATPKMPGPRQPPNLVQPFGDEDDGLLALLFPRICVVYMHLSYSTATIYPGNSGSPVTNSGGEVVGVMNSASPMDNRGNFIPLEYVREILED